MRYLKKIALLIILLAVVAGVFYVTLQARYAIVETTRPKTRDVMDLVIASGTLRPIIRSALGSEISGTIKKVLVKEGDRVDRNQIVLTLNEESGRLKLEQALIAQETARAELMRIQQGPYQAEIHRARSELERAQLER